ncbi:LTA synthase family protein [Lactobacillus salsicarnum]|uniref:LTA synthase family protein n=2 Tax=Companilactobacillus mishanensis TaxID=2486008 RepID=A0A5P0ZII6_9LACO|nr:LTA synthase family protein [Companilactobacillus mishanensis]
MLMERLKRTLNTRLGFMASLVFLLWLKTIITYFTEFNLGATDVFQYLTMFINPIGFAIAVFSLCLFINRPKISYSLMLVIYVVISILIYANVLYYREFSNFIPVSTMLGVASVSKGLGNNTVSMISPHDFIYLLDFILLIVAFATKYIRIDTRPFRKLNAMASFMFGLMFFSLNLMISEANRPQLLGRTFDQTYLVKYLGLPAFTIYDGLQTVHSDQVKSTAIGTDIDPALKYVQNHYAKPDPEYYGIAKKKNIIIIHLESFQQALINLRVNGQEVTPFLNGLYNSNETLSFDNFYHQVGQGKTSDAETMLETGLFGTASGTFFNNQASSNTLEGAPAILQQTYGYSSAVFHGNVSSFYHRDSVYKNLGYNYFFDKSYFNSDGENSIGMGLKDKLLFAESPKYLEQMQQPFYTKFITLTNHWDFGLDDIDNDGFKTAETPDKHVNGYFLTAHYLDASLKEFFEYLKTSGLYDNSMVILYGDHYGISNDRNRNLAPILGYNQDNWNDFDNAQMQRVPFMIHMKGLNGGIRHEYGGEIDVLPTLLHLEGINSSKYIQVGTDLLSKEHSQLVPFRNGDFVTPKYTVLKNQQDVYANKTGELIDLKANPDLADKVAKWNKQVKEKFKISDNVQKMNLLRFYTPLGFTPVDPAKYSYQHQIEQMIKIRDDLGNKSTSMYSKNGNTSTTNFYNTDAPELRDNRNPIDNINSAVKAK